MKKIKIYTARFCQIVTLKISLCLIFTSINAHGANPYQSFDAPAWGLEIKTNYLKSTANFDADGTQSDLPNDNYFQLIDVTNGIRWGLHPSWAVTAGFNVGITESSDPFTTRSNSTVNRVDLGTQYLIWDLDTFSLFGSLEYRHAIEKILLDTDSVVNSDGASEIKPELFARYNLDNLYTFGQAGINYRTEGLSTLLTYGFGLEFRFSEIGLGAKVKGHTSIKDDQYTDLAITRDLVNSRVNAGSKKFFAINPNATDVELNFNFAMSRNLLFQFFAGYAVAGSNTAAGWNAGAVINYNFGEPPYLSNIFEGKSTQNKLDDHLSRDVTPDDFIEQTDDGVNQDYFKPIPPTNPDYIEKIDSSENQIENPENHSSTPVQIKKVKKKTQTDLDNMEYTIKLRQKNKKKKK